MQTKYNIPCMNRQALVAHLPEENSRTSGKFRRTSTVGPNSQPSQRPLYYRINVLFGNSRANSTTTDKKRREKKH